MKVQTLKGFRDFLPEEAKKRQFVINTFKQVFESFGFEPLETPALEYEEVLLGKYGEEGDKLMYRFKDLGGRKVALRYDQTVPLSRVIAQYGSASSPQGQNLLPMPFKRYQIQPVWRAENTQKGRFREFLQCDADIVGTSSSLSDAEIVALAAKAVEALGFKKFKVLINDRTLFGDLPIGAIGVVDKLKKIGEEGVIKELIEKKFAEDENSASLLLRSIRQKNKTERLQEIFTYLGTLGVEPQVEFSPTLARGLDYYTSTIFEVEIDGYTAGSVCGGGRYDKLIGMFSRSTSSGQAGRDIPAVGFAFGFDRVMEAMEQFDLFPKSLSATKVLITIFNKEMVSDSMALMRKLREKNIAAEVYLDENASLEKQLKYADQKGIPFAVIIGPDEKAKNMVTLRNMETREQKTIKIDDIINEIT